MKRTAILASVLCLSLAACKKKEGDSASKPADKPADKPATPAAPPPPFTGKLTIERVMGAKDVVSPNVAWAEGLAKLKAQLGEPTRVKENKYEWAVAEGDDCAYVYVDREPDGAKYGASGEIVGAVMSPMKVGKDGPMMNRKDCLEITGVTAGPPEDPNAAPPPADGSAVTVDAFRTGAIAGRSKWKDQAVKVSGLFASTTKSTSGDKFWVTVGIKGSDTDAGKPVTCSLAENTESPAELKMGDPVELAGKVKIQEWTSMGSGDTTLEAALTECTVTAVKPAKKGK
jgi:hypothetical protein